MSNISVTTDDDPNGRWRSIVEDADPHMKPQLIAAWKEEILEATAATLRRLNGPQGLFLLHGQVTKTLANWPSER